MGILDDLAMGFGLKARTEDYDARTARNIALSNDPSVRNARNQQERTMALSKLYARGDDFARDAVNRDRQAQSFLTRSAMGRDNYNPQIIPRDQDDRGFFQRALFSPESPESPRPYAIGPMKLDGPLQIPSMMGILNSVANKAFDRPLTGKPLPSGAVDALDGTKPFNKVANPAGILPVDDGQITEEELADVTEDAAASSEFEGMNATEIKEALMAKFYETGEDPTLEYDYAELFPNDDVFVKYLKTRPMEDRATAFANRLAGR